MFDAKVTLTKIKDKVLDNYDTNEGWIVKKTRLEYVNRIVAIIPTIYQKDKVHYFNNKSIMMIFKTDHGKSINWATIMYSQLVKKLIRWEKCQKNMIEGTTKREPKKDVCHFAIVLEVLFQKWFPLNGAKIIGKKK
jgi:hypothetical protein